MNESKSPKSYLGSEVSKTFSNVLYVGVVIDEFFCLNEESNVQELLYSILYIDHDREDWSFKELEEGIKKYEEIYGKKRYKTQVEYAEELATRLWSTTNSCLKWDKPLVSERSMLSAVESGDFLSGANQSMLATYVHIGHEKKRDLWDEPQLVPCSQCERVDDIPKVNNRNPKSPPRTDATIFPPHILLACRTRLGDKSFGNQCRGSSRLEKPGTSKLKSYIEALSPFVTAWYEVFDKMILTGADNGCMVLEHKALPEASQNSGSTTTKFEVKTRRACLGFLPLLQASILLLGVDIGYYDVYCLDLFFKGTLSPKQLYERSCGLQHIKILKNLRELNLLSVDDSLNLIFCKPNPSFYSLRSAVSYMNRSDCDNHGRQTGRRSELTRKAYSSISQLRTKFEKVLEEMRSMENDKVYELAQETKTRLYLLSRLFENTEFGENEVRSLDKTVGKRLFKEIGAYAAERERMMQYHCNVNGCEFKSKRASHLKRHKAVNHDIDATYYLCNVDGCEYKTKDPSNLKRHKAMIHDIDVTYYLCDGYGCEYKAKKASHLRTHKAAIHDIDVTYYLCNTDGCEYKSKDPSNLKTHKANVHDIDVTYYLCNADGCEYKSKHLSYLKTHKAGVHDIDVTYYLCNADGCEYKAKQLCHLKPHKANVHDIDVTYYLCNIDGCEYKAKQPGNLKKHKAVIHDIDVTYYLCNADGCEYKTKQTGHLYGRKKRIHGIS